MIEARIRNIENLQRAIKRRQRATVLIPVTILVILIAIVELVVRFS